MPAGNDAKASATPMIDALRAVASLPDLVELLDELRHRAAREVSKARVSIDDISRRTGIPRSTIHVYVTGRSTPPPAILDRIVSGLGADRDERLAWLEALDRVTRPSAPPPDVRHDEPGVVRPNLLPPAPRRLVGRESVLAEMDAIVEQGDSHGATIALVGPGGMGKTAVAVHWARSRQASYPDGVIYLDLRGFSSQEPLDTQRTLLRILASLGYSPAELPTDVELITDLFRSVMAVKRLILVLDNVRDAEHVGPLLPGSTASTVIVTSRGALPSLVVQGWVTRIELGPLSPEAALQLFEGVEQTDELRSVLRRCGGMPLALQVVRERIESYFVAELAVSMEDDTALLDALDLPDSAEHYGVRKVLAWSYDILQDEQRRYLRHLAVIPGPRLHIDAAGAVLGLPERDLRRHLAALAQVSLLGAADPDHWQRHDLVTAFSAERLAAEDDEDTRKELARRLRCHYLDLCTQALGGDARTRPMLRRDACSCPEEVRRPRTSAEAWRTLVDEEDAVVAVLEHAIDHDPDMECWVLAEYLAAVNAEHAVGARHLPRLERVLHTAKSAGVAEAIVALELVVAAQQLVLSQHDQVVDHLRNAAELAHRTGMARAEAACRVKMSVSLMCKGRLADAEAELVEAQQLVEADDYAHQAEIALALGNVYASMGEEERAMAAYRRAAQPDPMGKRHACGVVALMNLLGDAAEAGRLDDAKADLEVVLADPLATSDELAGHIAEAAAYVHARSGDFALARRHLDQAFAIVRLSQDAILDISVHLTAATIAEAEGDLQRAQDLLEWALAATVSHDLPLDEASVRQELAEVLERLQEPDAAAEQLRIAQNKARGLNDKLVERLGEALVRLEHGVQAVPSEQQGVGTG